MNVASRGHAEVVQELLARGARVDARDRAGRTPLELARAKGHAPAIEILRAHGDEANA